MGKRGRVGKMPRSRPATDMTHRLQARFVRVQLVAIRSGIVYYAVKLRIAVWNNWCCWFVCLTFVVHFSWMVTSGVTFQQFERQVSGVK